MLLLSCDLAVTSMFVKYSLKVFAKFSGCVISCLPSLMMHGVLVTSPGHMSR